MLEVLFTKKECFVYVRNLTPGPSIADVSTYIDNYTVM